MPDFVKTDTAGSPWSFSSTEPASPSQIARPTDPVARQLEGSPIDDLRNLSGRRLSMNVSKTTGNCVLYTFLDMDSSSESLDQDVQKRSETTLSQTVTVHGKGNSRSFLEIDRTIDDLSLGNQQFNAVDKNRASGPDIRVSGFTQARTTGEDVEALSIRPSYVNGLQVAMSSKTYAVAAEFVAKFLASGMHFGLARQYTEAALEIALRSAAPNHPLAGAILDNARTQAIVAALVTAPVLAASHYIGEVHIRPLVLKAVGAQVVPTSAIDALPGDTSAQARMKAQQAAGKIGKAPADVIGLASFGIANGVRGALGGTSPLAATLTSGIAGGTMAGLHSLLNLGTHTEASDSSFQAPTHHVSTARIRSIQDVGEVILKSFRSVAGNGPIGNQLANTLQDVFGARGVAALQGLLIANLVKAQIADDFAGHSPTAGQKFGQATAATVALLGLAFFANLSLAARRGKTSGTMSGSIAALKSMDPDRSAQGGMHALMEVKNKGIGAHVWNTALKAVDLAAHTGKTLQTLPGHAVLDVLTLANRGARWMFSLVRGANRVTRNKDVPPGTEGREANPSDQ